MTYVDYMYNNKLNQLMVDDYFYYYKLIENFSIQSMIN